MEGKRPYPRIKPPYFPAVLGLYMCPTIVNNVETLCNVKHIVRIGGAEYAKIGQTEQHRHAGALRERRCPAARLLRIRGWGHHDRRTDQRYLRRHEARAKLKAVIPGGSSAKVLNATDRYKIKTKQARRNNGRELKLGSRISLSISTPSLRRAQWRGPAASS